MAKVFRLYTGGSDTYKGWNGSPAFPYTAAALANSSLEFLHVNTTIKAKAT